MLVALVLSLSQLTVSAAVGSKKEYEFKKEYEVVAGANHYFIAKNQAGKYGLLDEAGKEAIDFSYDDMAFAEDSAKYEYVKVTQNGTEGILDYEGEALVPVEFDKVYPYKEGVEIAAAYNGNKTKLYDLKGKERDKQLSEGEYQPVLDTVYQGKDSIKNEKDSELLNLSENNLLDADGNCHVEKVGARYAAQKYHTQTVGNIKTDRTVAVYEGKDEFAEILPEKEWAEDADAKVKGSLMLERAVSDDSLLLSMEFNTDDIDDFQFIYNVDEGKNSRKYHEIGVFREGKAFALDTNDELVLIDAAGEVIKDEIVIDGYKAKTKNLGTDSKNCLLVFKEKDGKNYKLYSSSTQKEIAGTWKKVILKENDYAIAKNEDGDWGVIDKAGEEIAAFGDFTKAELKKACYADTGITVTKQDGANWEVYYYETGEPAEQGFLAANKKKLIVAAVVLAVLLVLLAVLLTFRKKAKQKREEEKTRERLAQAAREKERRKLLEQKRREEIAAKERERQKRGSTGKSAKTSQKKTGQTAQNRSIEKGAQPLPLGGVKVVQGEYAGQTISLESGMRLRIGRDRTNNDLILNNAKVSRHHCIISWDGERRRYCVVDYSSNGVYLADGTRLEKKKQTWLSAGTLLLIGNEENIFELGRAH